MFHAPREIISKNNLETVSSEPTYLSVKKVSFINGETRFKQDLIQNQNQKIADSPTPQ